MKTKIILNLLATSIFMLLSSCGSDDAAPAADSTTTTSGVTSVENLPKATDAVSSSSSIQIASQIAASLTGQSFTTKAASSGVTFAAAGGLSWTSSHSRGMCESLNLSRDLMNEAAEPDKILCYIGIMQADGLFGSNVDDGDYKFFQLTENNSALGGIKFRIVKDSAGAITFFEMFMCMGQNSGNQDGYVSQTFNSDGSVAVVSKFIGSQSQGGVTQSYGGDVSVSGNISSSGAWTSKTIVGTRSYTESGGANNSSFGASATLTQGESTLTLTGYRYGTRYSGNDSFSFSDAFYSVMQTLGTSSMSTFAIGDGSSKYAINFSFDQNNDNSVDASFVNSNTVSWNGDTRANLSTASSGDHYTAANNGTAPTPASVSAVTFTSAQTWDCTAPSGFTSAVIGTTQSTKMQACDSKYGSSRTWIECSSAQ